MTVRNTTRRVGATLIEVLIAIFVMCIGLLCVLTLFVLGAQRMATAFKDDACARAAVNARAYAQIKGLRNDSSISQKFKNSGNDQSMPSDPLFVDPVGVVTGKMTLGTTTIQRVAPSYADPATDVLGDKRALYFSLLDDITFQKGSGLPKLLGTNVEREINYTWAYLVQRDRLGEPLSATAQLCVFNRRPKAGLLENAFPGSTMNPSDNSIVLSAATGTVNVMAGHWVLDVSDDPMTANKSKLGNFYRISGVRDQGGKIRLDLQSPLKGHTAVTANGTVVLMEGLVEVFDLGYGTK
jgi:hypothetical protein